MSKGSGVVWECQNCGSQFPKWIGQCPECQKWNSLVETVVSTNLKTQSSKFKTKTQNSKPQALSEILKTQVSTQRIGTGIGELDRVLGGGLVPGEVVLLAGEPGMGKSTLLSRVSLAITNSEFRIQNSELKTLSVLYVCGEESPGQVGLRLQRLGGSRLALNDSRLALLSETNVDSIVAEIEKQFGCQSSVVSPRLQVSRSSVNQSETGKLKTGKPESENRKQKTDNGIAIVDSIQTLTTDDLTGVAGSVGQVRESAGRLMQVAKKLNIPIFLVGHVTKDGTVAGPKVLEHMVDAVLVLEGERSGNFRILRAVKNRFGAVDEVGLFAMDNGDMKEVVNPGELLLGEVAGKVSGSVLGCTLEGLRPLILEVQALAVPSKLAVPRRVGQGISERKLQVLCAVIERYISRKIGEMDVFVSIAGGLKSNDPGLDLAVVGAVISSIGYQSSVVGYQSNVNRFSVSQSKTDKQKTDKPESENRKQKTDNRIYCGEVGLLGEVRQVQGWERREKEVKRLDLGKLIGSNQIKTITQLKNYL
ncbi:DNA repair protein RadA [Candidatus Collierbacteria bacterium]|nr:DNA repair protein RadA [Candidatus Collierbacteria bacterium]